MFNTIRIGADKFQEGNFNRGNHAFGNGIIIDGGLKSSGFGVYQFFSNIDGVFDFWVRYASGDKRPVRLYVNDKIFSTNALEAITGGFSSEYLKWSFVGVVKLFRGNNTFRIECEGCIPHIEQFRFKPVSINRREFLDKNNFVGKNFNKPIISSPRKVSAKHAQNNYIKTLRNNLRAIGIINGHLGFVGPNMVQIDLTNDCNNDCIGCWCNSPLLGSKKMPQDEKKSYIPFGLVKEIIDELVLLGVSEIYYAGGGEPFMHPEIMDVLEYTKSKGLVCYVNTNFTLVDENKINKIINIGVDHFTVSVWAASTKTYVDTHPNKTAVDFLHLENMLKLLNSTKKSKPIIKVYNVISRLNFFELEEMIDFAIRTHCESVEFTMIDTIPDATDNLLLSRLQTQELEIISNRVQANVLDKRYPKDFVIFNFDHFLRRVSEKEGASGRYDAGIIGKIPCYIGWDFSRIIADGNVNGCLKAHRIPVGNVFSDSFFTIWNSKKQKNFRNKTKKFDVSDKFFNFIGNDPNAKIGCYKSCDDLGRIINLDNMIKSFSGFRKAVFFVVSFILGVWFFIYRMYLRSKLALGVRLFSFLKNNKDILGIRQGRYALKGPDSIVVDLTNRCVNGCVGCWIHSPIINQKDKTLLFQDIEVPILKELVRDLKRMGTKQVRFTGGGEPFLYKNLESAIRLVKKAGIRCAITTSVMGFAFEKIEMAVQNNIDEISVSLWTVNKNTFSKLYPNKNTIEYEDMIDKLKKLKRFNERTQITVCIIFNSLNFDEAKELFDFAKDAVGVNKVYFTLIDVIEGQTDYLALDESKSKILYNHILFIEKEAIRLSITIDGMDDFKRRLACKGVNIGEYDKDIVNSMPCYVGWSFARVLANSDVVPCCRAVDLSVGNLKKDRFKKIWNNYSMRNFRAHAKFCNKEHVFFKNVGCKKLCDNLSNNIQTDKKIKGFSCNQEDILNKYARYLSISRT